MSLDAGGLEKLRRQHQDLLQNHVSGRVAEKIQQQDEKFESLFRGLEEQGFSPEIDSKTTSVLSESKDKPRASPVPATQFVTVDEDNADIDTRLAREHARMDRVLQNTEAGKHVEFHESAPARNSDGIINFNVELPEHQQQVRKSRKLADEEAQKFDDMVAAPLKRAAESQAAPEKKTEKKGNAQKTLRTASSINTAMHQKVTKAEEEEKYAALLQTVSHTLGEELQNSTAHRPQLAKKLQRKSIDIHKQEEAAEARIHKENQEFEVLLANFQQRQASQVSPGFEESTAVPSAKVSLKEHCRAALLRSIPEPERKHSISTFDTQTQAETTGEQFPSSAMSVQVSSPQTVLAGVQTAMEEGRLEDAKVLIALLSKSFTTGSVSLKPDPQLAEKHSKVQAEEKKFEHLRQYIDSLNIVRKADDSMPVIDPVPEVLQSTLPAQFAAMQKMPEVHRVEYKKEEPKMPLDPVTLEARPMVQPIDYTPVHEWAPDMREAQNTEGTILDWFHTMCKSFSGPDEWSLSNLFRSDDAIDTSPEAREQAQLAAEKMILAQQEAGRISPRSIDCSPKIPP